MPFALIDDPDAARRVVATLREPLLVLDERLRVEHANPSFHRAFGTSEEATAGVPLRELVGGRWDDPELRRRLEGVLEEDESFEGFELDRIFPDLGRRVLLLNGRSLTDGSPGATPRVLLAVEDVTEQRELEEELRRHARDLERSNADLEQFAYAASHDLQEPLRMVASYLELLERRYRDELDGEAREFIDYAVDGARRMKALINGLLQYSRVGRKDGSLGEVDLDAVLDDVLDDLAGPIELKDAEVRRDGPLPTAWGSRDQLRQVLQNLVENALVHHGDDPPHIEVRGERSEDGDVHVAVADRGPGIPPAMHEKVFGLFQQLDPHGAGHDGSGMGLALCRKVVERHDGRIWIESEPGRGATFHFKLSLRPEENR